MSKDGYERITVSTVPDTDCIVITLPGAFDAAAANAIDTSIRRRAFQHSVVIVDLTDTVRIDVRVARTLSAARGRCWRDGVGFAAVGAQGQPLQMLEALDIAKGLNAYLSMKDATELFTDDVGSVGTCPGARSLDAAVHKLLAAAAAPGIPAECRESLRHQAVEVALPLAHSIAQRYGQRGEPLEDLIQVASLALVRSVREYDPARGSGFLAYAVPTVRGELRKHFRDHTWMIRPPRRVEELRARMAAAWPELAQQLGRIPGTADFADHLGAARVAVEEAMLCACGHSPASLDATVADGDERTLHDVVGVDEAQFGLIDSRLTLRSLIAALPERQREILGLRLTTDLSQAEIGVRFGMSQMGVSRMLSAIAATLRGGMSARAEATGPVGALSARRGIADAFAHDRRWRVTG